MSFRLSPIEKRAGTWQVNYLALAGWTLLINFTIMGLLFYFGK